MCDTALPSRNVIITFGQEVFEMTLLDFIIRGTRPKTDSAVAKILFGTGMGMAVGLVAGMLLAPRSGSETRRIVAGNVKNKAEEIKKNIHALSSEKHNPYNSDDILKNSEHPTDE